MDEAPDASHLSLVYGDKQTPSALHNGPATLADPHNVKWQINQNGTGDASKEDVHKAAAHQPSAFCRLFGNSSPPDSRAWLNEEDLREGHSKAPKPITNTNKRVNNGHTATKGEAGAATLNRPTFLLGDDASSAMPRAGGGGALLSDAQYANMEEVDLANQHDVIAMADLYSATRRGQEENGQATGEHKLSDKGEQKATAASEFIPPAFVRRPDDKMLSPTSNMYATGNTPPKGHPQQQQIYGVGGLPTVAGVVESPNASLSSSARGDPQQQHTSRKKSPRPHPMQFCSRAMRTNNFGGSSAGGYSWNKGMVACTRTQAIFTVVFVLGALVAAIFITYVVTKDSVEKHWLHATSHQHHTHSGPLYGHPSMSSSSTESSSVTPPSKVLHSTDSNVSRTNLGEEEEVHGSSSGPSAAELRLSQNLYPLWYNLTIKVYVPGFVPIAAEKVLTFDAELLLKFDVRNSTNVIELNSLKLEFNGRDGEPADMVQLLKEAGGGDGSSNSRGGHHHHRKLPSEQASNTSPRLVPSGFRITHITVNETVEKVFFQLDGQLPVDSTFYLRVRYRGPIARKLSGLYLTQYTARSTGKTHYAAVSQLEPTDARRIVPCFDEPDFKAVWRLKVIHPRGSRAVSNALELREDEPLTAASDIADSREGHNATDEPNWLVTTFDDTLPMSSYLLALVVSDFDYVEGHTKRNTRFRIWARADAINLTSYALESGIRVLEYYEDYYNIPFPLPKQDMMAFPDFAAGAMENWGLVTYREKYLLYSPQLYTPQQKMAVASVVSHELAHQWFGNLVTMKWWSDLWLNEGFATLMEYAGTDAISQGGFRMKEYFLIEALDSAFDRDARATSHPLFFEIRKAEDVSEAFDSITYSKGASVLRMISAILGEEHFRRGLNIYLNRYKYKNAEHADLWNALTEAVPHSLRDWADRPFDVLQFAKQWTNQMGYPVVEVQRVAGANRILLTQKRFKLDESALERPKFRENGQYKYKWDVPIWWSVNGTEQPMAWLHSDSARELDGIDEDMVFTANSESRGFYRVQYSNDTLERITSQLGLDHQQISVRTRARIIDDTFTLAEAGRVPYEAALNLTHYLAAEREYLPWEMAFTGLTVIQSYFGDEPEADYLRDYVKHIIRPLFEREIAKVSLGNSSSGSGGVEEIETMGNKSAEETDFFGRLLNMRVIQKMCSLRDSDCINHITTIYHEHFVRPCFLNNHSGQLDQQQNLAVTQEQRHPAGDLSATSLWLIDKQQPNQKEKSDHHHKHAMSSQCSKVPVSFRTLTYCEGVHYGSEKDWERMLALFEHEEIQVERDRLMAALACSRDTHTLKKLLAMAADINNTVIRLQDKPSVFGHVAGRVIGQKVIVDFFIDHWAQIYDDFKEQQTLLRSIIAHSIVGNSQRTIDEVERFMSSNEKTTRNWDIFKQRLEVIKTNRKWMEKNFRSLSEWFREQNARRRGLYKENASSNNSSNEINARESSGESNESPNSLT